MSSHFSVCIIHCGVDKSKGSSNWNRRLLSFDDNIVLHEFFISRNFAVGEPPIDRLYKYQFDAVILAGYPQIRPIEYHDKKWIQNVIQSIKKVQEFSLANSLSQPNIVASGIGSVIIAQAFYCNETELYEQENLPFRFGCSKLEILPIASLFPWFDLYSKLRR